MIYDGIITKPPLDELYHEKAHKYVERYKSPTGKWVYKYTELRDKMKEKKKKKQEEDPYYGLGPKERFIFKTSVKTAEGISKGYDKLKTGLKKTKLNRRHGNYSAKQRS